MKVVQIVPSLSRSAGGLFVSISHLVRSSIAQGEDVYVFSATGSEDSDDLLAWAPAHIERFATTGPRKFAYARGIQRRLDAIFADVVHAHGMWTHTTIAAARWSRRAGKPYIISVHGMLEPWALQQSAIKKRIARWLYQDRVAEEARCLRATSAMEIESIRSAGIEGPVALVPNGIDLPAEPATDYRTAARKQRTALFLSRLHPKKGILNLVEAWRQIGSSDWRLDIVGPNEAGHRSEIEAAINRANLHDSVRLLGPTWGDQRFDHYWRADLFVLPSFSENFGLVVAEALACRVPVITTRALPWHELQLNRCGWWIEVGVEPLVAALSEAMNMSDEQRLTMGSRGRDLIAQNYTWASAGQRMSATYRWMLGRADRPDFVQTS